MQSNGFSDIWKEANKLYEDELNELARFSRQQSSIQEFKRHFLSHKDVTDKNGKIIYSYNTEDEYDDAAHELSSFPAEPLNNIKDYEVYGYIDQQNRYCKFTLTSHDYAFVVYVPNEYDNSDYYGTAITYFHRPLSTIIYSANPYHKLRPGDEDHRYKSDLDGRFVGLNYFKPILRGNRAVTQSEANQIKSDILNGDPISIR